jgi:hypothetical protein
MTARRLLSLYRESILVPPVSLKRISRRRIKPARMPSKQLQQCSFEPLCLKSLLDTNATLVTP